MFVLWNQPIYIFIGRLSIMINQKRIELRSTDVMSDEALIRLKRRFETHLDDYRMHLLDYAHEREQIFKEQENTARNLASLHEICKVQAEATKGLVELWTAANTIRKFVVWSMGFSGAAVFFAWAFDVVKI